MTEAKHLMSLDRLLESIEVQLSRVSTPEAEEFLLREYEWFLEDPQRIKHWQHRPIPIAEWIDKPYAGALKNSLRPKIRQVLIEVFENPGQYDEVVIIGGIGIGKSFLSGAGTAYLIHRLLCMRSPKEFFGLAGEDVPIAIMNMSVNGTQAKKVVFNQVGSAIRAPWFMNMRYMADSSTKSELRLPKSIEVLPGNSQETYFVGFDLYTGILDEGAWHEVTKDKDYAEEGYNAMQRRVKSRFPGKGMLFIITSPRYVDDFVERKIKEAEYNPRIYARRIRAWESMPRDMDVSSYFYFDPTTNQILSEGQLTREMRTAVEDRVTVTQ